MGRPCCRFSTCARATAQTPVSVLEDVSFVLNDGEHVGLIGPTGAGKSTLYPRCPTLGPTVPQELPSAALHQA
jgi:ABC-type glutathione transport system ATPase component